MNLFHKKTNNPLEKEEKLVDLDKFKVISESEEKTYTGVDIKGKGLYYPNPALFRRLIEGTTLDRRKNVEIEQKNDKVGGEQKDMILPKNSMKFEKVKALKRRESKNTSDKSGQKKKFIYKERKRLGHIVHEVLGYPEKHSYSNPD